MNAMASHITGVSIICSTACSGADQRKHQNSASLVCVRAIHRWPVDSPHKGPVTRKMFPLGDVIMEKLRLCHTSYMDVGRNKEIIKEAMSSERMTASCWTRNSGMRPRQHGRHFQKTFSDTLSCIKHVSWFEFHINLFSVSQLPISQNQFS